MGIASSDVHRNKGGGTGWRSKAIAFALSSGIAGIIAGATLGGIGQLVPPGARLTLVTLASLFALALGVQESLQLGLSPVQCNHETPQSWLRGGALRWALTNGAALGLGCTSRIGFWLWYVIPAGCLAFADPWAGAAVYGTYALARGLAPLGYLMTARYLWLRRLGDGDSLSGWLLTHRAAAQVSSGAALACVGAAVGLLVGP